MRRLHLKSYVSLLIFSLALLFAPTPVTTAAQSSTATVVNAYHLNVRTSPGTSAGIVAVIDIGHSFPVIGRNADSSWWQIVLQPSGIIGWSSGRYLSVTNAHLVPVVPIPAPVTANLATAVVNTAGLNLRVTPDPYNGQILRVINEGQVYQITGQSSFTPRWYQLLMPDGITGWVNGRYVNATNTNLVPVIGEPPAVQAYGTVTAYFLNVRSTPNPYIMNIQTVIARGETYPVIGRNADSSWWQIRLPSGLIGWVSGKYFPVTNGHTVAITG